MVAIGESSSARPSSRLEICLVWIGLLLYAVSLVAPAANVPILEWGTRETIGTVLPLFNARQPMAGWRIASLSFLTDVNASPDPVPAGDAIVVALAWLASFPLLLSSALFRRPHASRWLRFSSGAAIFFAWLPVAVLPRAWRDSPLLPGYFIWAIAMTMLGVAGVLRTQREAARQDSRTRTGLLRFAAVAGAIAVVAACAWSSATVRGATGAVLDDWRGGLAFYGLGCTNSPPREPLDFRIWELLRREYHVHQETVGGIAPGEYHIKFVTAYNRVADQILRWRYGSDYLGRLRARAATDLYQRQIRIEGCYQAGSQTLMTARNEGYSLRGAKEILTAAQRLDQHQVSVEGTTIEVRNSEWREWGRPEIAVRNISDVTLVCAPLN